MYIILFYGNSLVDISVGGKSGMSIRLMIADDQALVRAGMAALVQGADIEVVCQADSCEQTIRYAMTCKPDVLLLDLRLGDKSGLEALEQIRRVQPSIAVLILSASEDAKAMAISHKLGAVGWIVKGASRDDVIRTLERVAAGRTAWNPRQVRQIACRAASIAIAQGDTSPLSPREKQTLAKILDGLSNEAIAEALEINIETVKQHVKRLLKKLFVEDRTQAALWALRNKEEWDPDPVECGGASDAASHAGEDI
jgi:DNA-binding NarL/FixJ family response regulator